MKKPLKPSLVANKVARMMKVAVILVLLASFAAISASAQYQFLTNKLTGTVAGFGLVGRSNIVVDMFLVGPINRTINGVFISNDPLTTTANSTGDFSFTNVQWGKYKLIPRDSSGSWWVPIVGTNNTGTWSLAALVTNTAAFPPSPATNYYTMAQVDAMIASTLLADDKVFSVATQGSTMPSILPPAVCYTLRGGFFVKTNAVADTNGWNQLIADRP